MAQLLVIDDDLAIQLLLSRTLTRSGYEVIVASNGVEGLEKAQHFQPALIICDWLMPQMNGLDVCRQIKANPNLSTTFFILLTALDSVEDRVKGLDAGADDFLCKPIEMNELQARVRAGLRLYQLSHDLQQQKQLLEAELAEAAEYVRSILPEPLISTQLQIDFRFLPCLQLGGDSFDYYWLDDDHLLLYLLDVSGHGLRSALPSLSVINLLRSQGLSQVNYYYPLAVLQGLNKAFQMNTKNDKYFTIWYGVYNCKNRQLSYASAGHPPAILLSSNMFGKLSVQRLKTQGFPIGMFPESEYYSDIVEVKSNSSLYIFSDGIYEIEQEHNKILGLETFINILKEYQTSKNRNLDQLIYKLKSLYPKTNFDDDLSVMQIDFC
jgi:sigma-B regulation protein RsbU (phosphoserine phosphatase)